MDFLNWYDWITPTNPYASIFFGVLFTIIIAIIVWFESKRVKTTFITFLAGISLSVIGVIILNLIGFYA